MNKSTGEEHSTASADSVGKHLLNKFLVEMHGLLTEHAQ